MTTVADFFPSKYLEANDLKGKDYVLTISRIDADMFTDNSGQEVRKPIVYFQEAKKGLVLNKTNARCIADMYGETVEDWVGKRITVGTAWIDAFGKQTEALRVRPGLRNNAPLPTAEELEGTGIVPPADNRPMVPATGPQDDEDLGDSIPF